MDFSCFKNPNVVILLINLLSFYSLLIYFFYIFFIKIYDKSYFYDKSVKQIITLDYYKDGSETICSIFEGDSFPKEIIEVIKAYTGMFNPSPFFVYFISFFSFSLINHLNFKEIVYSESTLNNTEMKILNTNKEIIALMKEIHHDSTKDNSTAQALLNNLILANRERKKRIIKLRESKEALQNNLVKFKLSSSINKFLLNLQFYLINFIIFVLDVNNYTKTCLSINFTDLHLKWDIKIWTEGFNYLNIGFTFLFSTLAFFYFIWIVIYMVDRRKAKKIEPKLKNYFSVCFFYFYLIHLFIFPRSLFDFNLKCFFYLIPE